MAPSPSDTAPTATDISKWRVLSVYGEDDLASITPYRFDQLQGLDTIPSPGPASRIEQMIYELVTRLDTRTTTAGPTLEAEPLGATQFHLFGKLPNELKDMILKFAALNAPRRVNIIWKGGRQALDGPGQLQERNPPILLRQVSKYFRSRTPKELGYKEIVVPCGVHSKTCTYLYNPQIDLLGIPHMDSTYVNKVGEVLKAAGIFKNIRYVTIAKKFVNPQSQRGMHLGSPRTQAVPGIPAHLIAQNAMGSPAGLHAAALSAQIYPYAQAKGSTTTPTNQWIPSLYSANSSLPTPFNGTRPNGPLIFDPGVRDSFDPVLLSDFPTLELALLANDQGNCLHLQDLSTGNEIEFDPRSRKKSVTLTTAATSRRSAFSRRDGRFEIRTDHYGATQRDFPEMIRQGIEVAARTKNGTQRRW